MTGDFSTIDFAQILRKLLFENHITATELAKEIDVPQPTIHRILKGKSQNPRLETLNKIATYLGMSVDELAVQASMKIDISEIPIIDLTISQNINDQMKNATDKVISTRQLSHSCFAIRLNDTSMAPVFTLNSILIVDPIKEVTDRCYVLALLNDSQVIVFRQIIIDGDHKFLKPFNPDLSAFALRLLSKNDQILGVLVEARQLF